VRRSKRCGHAHHWASSTDNRPAPRPTPTRQGPTAPATPKHSQVGEGVLLPRHPHSVQLMLQPEQRGGVRFKLRQLIQFLAAAEGGGGGGAAACRAAAAAAAGGRAALRAQSLGAPVRGRGGSGSGERPPRRRCRCCGRERDRDRAAAPPVRGVLPLLGRVGCCGWRGCAWGCGKRGRIKQRGRPLVLHQHGRLGERHNSAAKWPGQLRANQHAAATSSPPSALGRPGPRCCSCGRCSSTTRAPHLFLGGQRSPNHCIWRL